MRWKRILVPHDFSPSAEHAAALAQHEAKLHGAEIFVLHVVEMPNHLALDVSVVPPETGTPVSVREYASSHAHAHCQQLVGRLAAAGVQATTHTRVGAPVDEINRFVAEHAIDLIVMGTHGRSGFRKLVAGSVAERVVRTSTVPVLTTRHAE